MDNLKIYVCYSCDSPILDEFKSKPRVYVPVKCGGYVNDGIRLSDAEGDSISEYNPYVNEMSLIWAVGKNFEKFGSPEYLGFAHYRRYLDVSETELRPDVILCHKSVSPAPEGSMYGIYHVASDLDMFMQIFRQTFPESFQELLDYFRQREQYSCNLFVMHRDLFAEYFRFIDGCARICVYRMFPNLDLDGRDRYQKRALGFILERMTSCWIWNRLRRGDVSGIDVPVVEANVQSMYSRV